MACTLSSSPFATGRRSASLTNRAGSSEGAGVLLLGRGDGFEVLVWTGHRWARAIDVPLVFQLGSLERLHRVHFMHELVVPGPEISRTRLEQVELGTFFPMLDQLGGFRRLYLVHGLGQDFQGDVIAPGLVLGRLVVLLGEGCHERLGAWRVDEVMPNQWPGAEEVTLARPPGHRRVETEARDRKVETEF